MVLSSFEMFFLLVKVALLSALALTANGESSLEEGDGSGRYIIEGRVFPLSDYQSTGSNWQAVTRVHVNGGEFIGML